MHVYIYVWVTTATLTLTQGTGARTRHPDLWHRVTFVLQQRTKGVTIKAQFIWRKRNFVQKKNWTERPKSYIKLLGLKQVFCKVTLQCQIYTTENIFYFWKLQYVLYKTAIFPLCVYIMLLQTFYEKLEHTTFWIFYCHNNV